MKLVSFLQDGHDRLGVLINDLVYDMEVLHPDLPNSMGLFFKLLGRIISRSPGRRNDVT